MKLPQPFVKLPLRFDAHRLAEEALALPAEAWARHPNSFPGNSALRLISVGGGENDEVGGRMEMTAHLDACPYIRQVLASFGVVWGRSRLMRLAPRASVPEHVDTNYHWFTRVRVHIPVLTRPGVSFHCDDQVVHMAAGEAWIFDNWRLHRVENATDEERIHLVADTSGSAAFWNMAFSGMGAGRGRPLRQIAYQPGLVPALALEHYNTFRVMPPSEVELLLGDLGADLMLQPDMNGTMADLLEFRGLLRSFCADWRQLWVLHGDSDSGIAEFRRLSQALREVTQPFGEKLCTRSNRLPVMRVLGSRVIAYMVNEELSPLAPPSVPRVALSDEPSADVTMTRRQPKLERPVFIMAAPRSGSTLLFETLACTPQFRTVGGEAHWLVEGFDHLSPGAPGIDDNRIDASHATSEVSAELERRLIERLRDAQGRPLPANTTAVRLLEKTPKNALRIPFFARLFPDARFVFLWRDPCENISSIIEAWKSGKWVTYDAMPGWNGPWSLILPPGWRELRGKPLGDIAAFQWETTNRIALDDLAQLPASRWMSVSYADFLADTPRAVQRICAFAGIEFDAALLRRVGAPLPLSRYTQTRPAPDKWRKNADAIEPQLAALEVTWARLRALPSGLEAADRYAGLPPRRTKDAEDIAAL
jgi:hypothetical protein